MSSGLNAILFKPLIWRDWIFEDFVRPKKRAKMPASRYRLSANCQPRDRNVVAGAGFEPATFGL